MANIVRTVEILFSAKDSMSMKLTAINQSLELLKKTVQTIMAPLEQLGDAILNLDGRIAGYASTLGTDVVDASMSLESVMIDLKRLLGEQSEQFDELIQSSRDLSREFGVALDDVIQSVIEFKRANFDAKESLDLTREALTLVRVGFVDMGTATESLVKILKGFGAGAEKANEIVDILSITSNTYATNVEKLAIGMAELAPIASKVGFSMAETAGLATKVIEVFQSGEEAATALKTGFTRLATGSAQVQKAYDKLKISGEDANGMLKDGKTMLGEIAGAMGRFTEAEQVQISAWLVGNRQAQKMVDIFTDYDKVIEIGIKALSDRQYAEKQLAEVMKSTLFQLDKLQTGWQELKAAMGDDFLPIVSLVLQGIHAIETALTDTVKSGALKEVADQLVKYGELIKSYLDDIATAIPEALRNVDLKPLLDSWDSVADTLSKIFDTAKIDNADDLADKIQTLVNAMVLLVNVTNGMIKPWTDLANKLLETIPILGEVDSEIAQKFGNILGHVQMIQHMGWIWYGVYRAMGDDVETFQDRAAAVADKVAKKQQEEVVHLAKKQEAWDSVLAYIEAVINTFSDGLDENGDKMLDWTARHRESLKKLEEAQTRYIEMTKDGVGDYTRALQQQRTANEETAESITWVSTEGEKLALTIEELASEINDMPVGKEIDIRTERPIPELKKELEEFGIEIIELPGEKIIAIKTEMDEMSWAELESLYNAKLATLHKSVDIVLELDLDEIDRISTVLKTELPEEQRIKIAMDGVDAVMEELLRIKTELSEVEQTKEVKMILAQVEEFLTELSRIWKALDEGPDEHNIKILLKDFQTVMSQLKQLQDTLDATPTEKVIEIKVKGGAEAKATFDGLNVIIKEMPGEVNVEVKAEVDKGSFEAITKRIDVLSKDANDKLKIKAQLDTAQFQAAADTMIAQINADASKAIAVIDGLTQSIGRLSDNVAGMFNSLADMYNRIIDLGEKVIDLGEKEAEVFEETMQTLDELKSEIEATIGVMDDYLDKVREITDAIDDQEDSINALENELAQYERAVDRLESGISTEGMEKDLDRVRKEIKSTEKALNKLYAMPYSPENEAKINALERKLETLKREEEILQKSIDDSEAAREEFEKKILDLKKEIWLKQKEINDLAGDLPDMINDAANEWDSWMNSVEEMKRRFRELYDMKLISEAEYNAAMKYLDGLEQQIMEFLGELDAMGITDIEELQKQTTQAQLAEIRLLKEEIMAQTEILQSYLDEQMSLQTDLIHKQMQLVDAQIEQIEARTEMMKSGDSMIKIQADGLEPELEAFMWKILENLQVQANAEFSEFLIGLRGLNLTTTTGSI